jgi:hypothetical protein
MIGENFEVSISLPVKVIDYILQSLAARPYSEVHGLIEKIRSDAVQQVEAAQKAEAARAEEDTKSGPLSVK